MKLKLNLLHKVGAAALAAGIAVLAAGLVMFFFLLAGVMLAYSYELAPMKKRDNTNF